MRNVGNADRWVRIIVGSILIGSYFVINGGYQWLWIVGAIVVLTGVIGYCPSYSLFNINTRKVETEE